MAANSKIEWCESDGSGRIRAHDGVVTTAVALTNPLANKEQSVMAVSTLSFRTYLSKLRGRRLGAFKAAAAKLGITFNDYVGRIESGQKNCTDCRTWKPREKFNSDESRWDGLSPKCRGCQNKRGRDSHIPLDASELSRMGPAHKDFIAGDKEQARHLVSNDVKSGRRPDPNDLYCALCGHKGSDRRHEYHHHMGYSKDHVYNVVALCTRCHHGEHLDLVHSRVRRANGTFSGKEVSRGSN